MKKADISIGIIVIAIIALIVLVVMVAIFTGRLTLWGKNVDAAGQGIDCGKTGSGRQWRPGGVCATNEEQVFGIFTEAKTMPTGACCRQSTFG